jgi:hypothetical protein
MDPGSCSCCIYANIKKTAYEKTPHHYLWFSGKYLYRTLCMIVTNWPLHFEIMNYEKFLTSFSAKYGRNMILHLYMLGFVTICHGEC